jgi:hypothetical protein
MLFDLLIILDTFYPQWLTMMPSSSPAIAAQNLQLIRGAMKAGRPNRQ